jgi:hypothetical protein
VCRWRRAARSIRTALRNKPPRYNWDKFAANSEYAVRPASPGSPLGALKMRSLFLVIAFASVATLAHAQAQPIPAPEPEPRSEFAPPPGYPAPPPGFPPRAAPPGSGGGFEFAIAPPPWPPAPHFAERRFRGPAPILLGGADADDDGVITRREFMADAQRRFRRLDTNDNGRLSQSELSAPRFPPPPHRR